MVDCLIDCTITIERYPNMPTIRELRLRQGMSQEALAVSAGVGSQTVRRAENGGAIRKISALAICRVLNVSLDQVEGLSVLSAAQWQNRKRA